MRGEPEGPTTVDLSLPLEAAEALHDALEDVLESGYDDAGNRADLERAYRILAWRILAARAGTATGLTARMAGLARDARSVEEYEAARDEALGPIIGGLENPENRDP